MRIALHQRPRLNQFFKGKDAIDARSDPTIGECGKDVTHETLHRLRALFRRSQLVGDAKNRQASGVQGLDIQRGIEHAVHIAHGAEPTLKRQTAQALFKDRTADGVDHQRHAFAAGGVHYCGEEIRLTGAQAPIESQRPQALEFVLRTRCADDFRAQRFGRLQRGNAHPGRHAVDQQPVAVAQFALLHQQVIADQEGERYAGRLFPVQRLRHRHHFTRIHQRVLRECSGASGHHPVPDPIALEVAADLDDFARALHANRFGARAAMQAMAPDEFAPIQSRRVQPHKRLRGARHRHRDVAHFNRLRHIAGMHPIRFHAHFPVNNGGRFSMNAFRPSA